MASGLGIPTAVNDMSLNFTAGFIVLQSVGEHRTMIGGQTAENQPAKVTFRSSAVQEIFLRLSKLRLDHVHLNMCRLMTEN